MSLSMSIKVMGAKEIIKKLDDMTKKSENELKKTVEKAVLIVEKDAKKNTPALSNRLRSSITHSEVKDGTAQVGTNVKYAPYVEFGTGKFSSKGTGRQTPWVYYSEELGRFVWTEGARPQPYLYPALASNYKRIEEMIKKTITGIFK